MGTLTAQILVGSPHPNHDGIEPSHYLFLSENSRPAWVLVSQNIYIHPVGFEDRPHLSSPIVWIPTVDNMLEDAMLMIAYYIVKHPDIRRLAASFTDMRKAHRRELFQMFRDDQRLQLYECCRKITHFPKLIISVFRYSTIQRQIGILDQYQMDVEVCMACYSRLYSEWDKKVNIWGSLPVF
jgi:hypothetical protein